LWGQAFLIAEKTFTAEGAENAEALILKQRATTKNFHRRGRWERRGSDFKTKGNNKKLSPQRAQRTLRGLF